MIHGEEFENEAERDLHVAAGEGRLTEYMRTVPGAGAVLYRCVSKVVYERLTRGIERGRGHEACAASVDRLEPDCLDRYQDDVLSVRANLLCHGNRPIENLHGWLVPRLRPVTVDANRRRRGERGALQRPRLPRWLDAEIGGDPWLAALAVEILTWVGVPAALAGGLWPLSAWAQRRMEFTGTISCTDAQAARDVERVLAAMRKNPAWYEKFVERPLGHKQAPTASLGRVGADDSEPCLLPLVPVHELVDARLARLAAAAIDVIESRVSRGEDLRAVVIDVVGVVFDTKADAQDMQYVPGVDTDYGARAVELLADPATVDRIVAAVVDILKRD